MLRCPFNGAHQVREGRLDIHISKCRKGNRRTLLNCRFNSEHLVPADSLNEHLQSCPDRGEGSQSSFKREDATAEADKLYPIRQVVSLPQPEERWDDDYEDPGNRRQPTQEPVFRPVPPGSGPAVRRAFCSNLNAAPRPAGPVQVVPQVSRASAGPPPQSTLQAAAEELAELPQPRTSSRYLPSAGNFFRTVLAEPRQPRTTLRYLPPQHLH